LIYRREDVRQLGFSCPLDEVLEEPLVLMIDEFVEGLDLERLHARYSEAGAGYYDPGMLLKVWFFAYCDRSWRCREVAQRVRYDVRYRYFVGSHRPDFRTLNRFRHDHLDLVADYFVSLVAHCEELGLIDGSVMALDGTKIRANASGRKRLGRGLRQEIGQRLRHDDEADEADEERVPEEAPSTGEKRASSSGTVSETDPEARMMKTGEGTIRLCYNAQVVVDNHQMIVAADVGTDASDMSSLVPVLEQASENVESDVGAVVADGGYYSGRNLAYAQERGLDLYIPKGRDEREVFGQEHFVYDSRHDRYRCPQGQWLNRGHRRRRQGVLKTIYRSTVKQCRGCPLKASCTKGRYRCLEVAPTAAYERQIAAKLASPEGQAIYARRQSLVEPVFGNLKFNLGFTRFSLRGLSRVKGEFLLVCIAHNLKKLAQWRGPGRVFSALWRGIIMIFALNNCPQRHLATIIAGESKIRQPLSPV
jgi:transposase